MLRGGKKGRKKTIDFYDAWSYHVFEDKNQVSKMTEIKKLNDYTFYLQIGQKKMMLTQRSTCYGKVWEMYIDNSLRRKRGSLDVKEFDSLKDVEKYYKRWRGIAKIAKGE